MEQVRSTSWLSNQKISTRFRLILFIQLLALGIIVGAIITSVPQLSSKLQQLSDAQNNLNIAGQIESELLRTRDHEQDFFIQSNMTLGESNINFLQYTNQIKQIHIAIDSLATHNPTTAEIIQDNIDIYNTNFREIVTTHIPDRQRALNTVNRIFDQIDVIAEFQGNALIIAGLSNLKNNIVIYELQFSPNRNAYDEFQVNQREFISNVKQTHQTLLITIENATLVQSVKTDLRNMLSETMVTFDQLTKSDATISELIRGFNTAVTTIEPIIKQSLDDADAKFQNESLAFVDLLQSSLFLIVGAIIISTIIIMILIPLITRSIATPIQLLADATQDIASGSYTRRITYQSNDELGQLATSFNQMGEAIEQRNTQLNLALEEAHEANRLKDEFLATMSHELRTPLNAIIGFLGIVRMTADLNEKNAHRLERASVNSERLLGLINNILDLSRIEAGRMKIVKSPVHIRDLANDLKSQLEVLIEDKDVQFILEVDENVPDEILTDEDAITKIITNLSGNAMKFTEEGKVWVNIFANEAQTSWAIKVRDTGIGIPIHMQETIFDRFRQVDSSSTREHGGSGLGLAIVSGLCREMEGTINVESDVGQGSTFHIVLPLELPETIEQ